MFRWFAPKCPLDTWEKTWTEWRMRWLTDQLDIDRLLHAKVILPTEQYFAPPFGTDTKSVRRLRSLIAALHAASPNPRQQLNDYFPDPELRHPALEELQKQGG